MTRTHAVITHPALRCRMAVALNQLRHEMTYAPHPPKYYWPLHHTRATMRMGVERMALLEQALDEAQYARISEAMWLQPESNLDLIQIERND